MSAALRVVRRLAVAVAAVGLLVTGLVAGLAPAASAHAYLDRSNPADGASLAHAPRQLRLGFSEHVVLHATRLDLLDAHGRQVPVTGMRLVTADPADTEEPAEVVADLPDLPLGSYRLSWSTLSSDDLHRTSGLVVFGVRTPVVAGGLHETRPAPVEALADAGVLAGLALALGGALAVRVLRRVPGTGRSRRTVRRLAAAGAATALVAALVTPAVETLSGDGVAGLLAGSYALRWTVREAGLALLLVAVVGGHRLGRGRVPVLVVAAVLAGCGQALLGHAAAQAGTDPLRVPVTVLHLLAALTWVGAVAGLAVGLARTSRAAGTVPVLRAALRGFAIPAGACVAVAAVTGVYLMSDAVVSVDAALATFYGRTLLVKLGLATLAGAAALVNHRRLRGRRDLDVPRRTVVAEAVVAGLLVAVTAVLVSSQPAREPQLVDAGPAPSLGPVASQVQDLQESVSLRPNRPGASVALVDVFDARRPARGPVTEVSVRLGHGASRTASPLGDGHWSVPVRDVTEGPVDVTVTVSRAGLAPVVATYPWVVAPATAPPATVVSRAPLVRPLRLLAAALALATLLVAASTLRRTRRRTGATAPQAVRPPGPVPVGRR